jgi:hypothetical protein
MLGVQRAPIACELLDIVVDRVDQFAAGNGYLPLKDQVFPQSCQMFKVRRHAGSMDFLPTLALLFFLVSLSRGSVLCLRHPGMIAPIPVEEKPLGFAVERAGTAARWSRAILVKQRDRPTVSAAPPNWSRFFVDQEPTGNDQSRPSKSCRLAGAPHNRFGLGNAGNQVKLIAIDHDVGDEHEHGRDCAVRGTADLGAAANLGWHSDAAYTAARGLKELHHNPGDEP